MLRRSSKHGVRYSIGEWLSDDGFGIVARDTRAFAEPRQSRARSPMDPEALSRTSSETLPVSARCRTRTVIDSLPKWFRHQRPRLRAPRRVHRAKINAGGRVRKLRGGNTDDVEHICLGIPQVVMHLQARRGLEFCDRPGRRRARIERRLAGGRGTSAVDSAYAGPWRHNAVRVWQEATWTAGIWRRASH